MQRSQNQIATGKFSKPSICLNPAKTGSFSLASSICTCVRQKVCFKSWHDQFLNQEDFVWPTTQSWQGSAQYAIAHILQYRYVSCPRGLVVEAVHPHRTGLRLRRINPLGCCRILIWQQLSAYVQINNQSRFFQLSTITNSKVVPLFSVGVWQLHSPQTSRSARTYLLLPMMQSSWLPLVIGISVFVYLRQRQSSCSGSRIITVRFTREMTSFPSLPLLFPVSVPNSLKWVMSVLSVIHPVTRWYNNSFQLDNLYVFYQIFFIMLYPY